MDQEGPRLNPFQDSPLCSDGPTTCLLRRTHRRFHVSVTNRDKGSASHWSMALILEFTVHKGVMGMNQGKNESRGRDDIIDSNNK